MIEKFGLVERDINWARFNELSEVGKFVYCNETAKAKNTATHKIVCMSPNGDRRNMYWTTNNTKVSVRFLEKALEVRVVDVEKMSDTPESRAGLEAYRIRAVEIECAGTKAKGGAVDAQPNDFDLN